MRAHLFHLLFIALLTLPSAAQAGATLERIETRGEIRVGLTGDYPPFSSFDPATNSYEGLDMDLARSLAGALGVRLVIVHANWPSLTADLQAGRFDIAMGGVSVTPAREAIGYFSVPMMSDGKTPITLCTNVTRFQTLAEIDQPGVRLVVNPGGTNEKFARAHISRATIIVHPDNKTIFDEIIAGRADLMITDAVETRFQAKRHPELCAVHPDKPFDHSEKAYWMPKDRELKALVDEWLTRLKEIGALQRKIDKWVD